MTSQITKDFKTKSRLRALADGGSPQRPPEPVIGTRSPLPPSRGDGGGLSREAVAAAMRHTPAPMPVPERTGIGALPADPLRNPRAILDARERAAGLRDGGRVKGPGGRTDDKVGPVMLSDEEYVLPGDTADAIGRDKLDAIRLATHDFKDKRKESALRGRADGGDGWYDDMMPMDHLADGGDPGAGGPRRFVINIDDDEVPRTAPQQPRGPSAPVANSMGPVTNPNVGPNGSREAQVFRNAAGTSFGDVAAAAKDPSLLSRAGSAAGSALRTAGNVLTKGAGVVGGGLAVKDMYDNGVNVGNAGDLAASAATFAGPVGTAGAAGWGIGRAIGNNMSEDTRDIVGGAINQGIRNVGKLVGRDWGVDDSALLQSKAGERMRASNPAVARPSPVAAASSALRSDQNPAQMVTSGSYQSRRLSEMGVPLDVQNSPPVVDSVLKNTRDFLRTGGTSQYQNLGTYGGDANIYGRADDPSRPGRINNFVGVGATASPDNVIGNTVQGYSPLRETPAPTPAPTPRAPAYDANAENAINKRYDKLADELRSSFGPKGKGNLAAELVSLEQLRANELGRLRSDYTSRATAELNAATQARNEDVRSNTSLANTNAQIGASATAAARATAAKTAEERDKARQSAEGERVRRMEDNAKVFENVADTFAAGDKGLSSQYRELLSTLPPEMHQAASRLGAEDKRAFYTNIMREQLGRNEGLVFGRDTGATAQNAIGGALLGTMARGGSGTAGKAVDKVLSKIPKVGPVVSALRPAENLMRLGPLIGAGAGAYATPVVENYTRYDPWARDPETGAALPAKKDIREALKYGAFDTYLNPFNDDVQTVSGRRTNKPTPDEEEASRRLRSALRSN